MSRVLMGGVLALFASVAVGHATVKAKGALKDGRAYVVIKPGTGPCPEGFMRSYRLKFRDSFLQETIDNLLNNIGKGPCTC